MNYGLISANSKAKICIIGYRGFNEFLSRIIDDFSDQAEFQFYDKIFDEAIPLVKELQSGEMADVFLSAGANASYLRMYTKCPFVDVRITGFDVLNALMKASKISKRVGIVSFKGTFSELEEVRDLLKLEIKQLSYVTVEQAKVQFMQLKQEGYEVIIGTSFIIELAEQANLIGVLLYSLESVRQAIEEAIQIATIRNIERTRHERLNSIIYHLNEGVVAVDIEERIEAINPSMEKILGISGKKIIGRKLSHISSVLSLEETLKTGTAQLEESQQVGYRTIVTNRIPIRERGVLTGAILTYIGSNAIRRAERKLRSRDRTQSKTAKYSLDDVIGKSLEIMEIKTLARKYAKIDSTILITGETGTGKELFAQGIHLESDRRENPFVAVNCGAFPDTLLESELFGHEEGAFTGSKRGGKEGLFEAAHRGTIFLDEIAEMPIVLQTRLLRVLQEKEIMRIGSNEVTPIDVRIIAATNKNLNERVAKGIFRADLLYRLNVLCITVPPLRDRMEDLPLITEFFLEEAIKRYLSTHSKVHLLELILPSLKGYHWPGNVRELENVINRVVISLIDYEENNVTSHCLRNIVPEIFDQITGSTNTENMKSINRSTERKHIIKILKECDGDYNEAAKRLGISRTTLWRKLKEID